MEMRRLLIICDMFPPAFAPRMGYLCKYLKRKGWDITVVTEQIDDNTFDFLTGNADTHYIRFYKSTGKITKRLEWICMMLLDILINYKDRVLIRHCEKLHIEKGFEGIICSTYRTFPLIAASKTARRFNLPLVADLRDIIEQYASDEYISHKFHTFPWLDRFIKGFFRRRLLRDRNRALRMARYVTTVSPWHVEVLKEFNPNTYLIYNGFDPEMFYPKTIKRDRFDITFTGRLLSLATRDPSLLFEAIRKLNSDGRIDPDRVKVVWYTDMESREIIEQEAKRFGVESFMEFHGYVPASDIPKILNSSSVLLSLANKFESSGPKGFMTTKFFESLAVEKPILCVRSDEAYLAKAIMETNSGLAATSVDEVCDFLMHYYNEWMEKGYTSVDVNKDRLSIYSRKEQANQFAALFDKKQRNG